MEDPDWDLYRIRQSTTGICAATGGGGGGGGGGGAGGGSVDDCYRRDRVGYKHDGFAVTDAVDARDLEDCSEQCHSYPSCQSFSFR